MQIDITMRYCGTPTIMAKMENKMSSIGTNETTLLVGMYIGIAILENSQFKKTHETKLDLGIQV